MLISSQTAHVAAMDYIHRIVAGGTNLSDTDYGAAILLAHELGQIGWDKFSAVYPFIGGTASSHAKNLISSTYDLTMNGTITHSADGMKGDGATGYADTGIIPSTLYAGNYDHHLSIYVNEMSVTDQSIDMECGDMDVNRFCCAFWNAPGTDDTYRLAKSCGGNHTVVSQVNGQAVYGNIIMSRTSSTDMRVYRAESLEQTITTAATEVLPSTSLIILGRRYTAVDVYSKSSSCVAFASVGAGLTDAECKHLAAAVRRFQAALGRNV